MKFWTLLLKSIRRRAAAAALVVLGCAVGVALLVAVGSLREQTADQFRVEGLGVDAILAPRGSALQIALSSLYHLDQPSGTLARTEVEALRRDPLTVAVLPFAAGHSYQGTWVMAVEPDFFSLLAEAGPALRFDAPQGGSGRGFRGGAEAVAGATAARRLRLSLGDRFAPSHGLNLADPVHDGDSFEVVGIASPTNTPFDDALYIPLVSFYALERAGEAEQEVSSATGERRVSGAMVKLRRIRGRALHPGIQQLRHAYLNHPTAQLVIPAEVMPELLRLVGSATRILDIVGAMVLVLGSGFLFAQLLTSLYYRRRELGLLRMLGAGRRYILGLVLAEAAWVGALSGLLGVLLGHALIALLEPWLLREAGLRASWLRWTLVDLLATPVAVLLAMAAGLLPAIRAYRLSVVENLRAVD